MRCRHIKIEVKIPLCEDKEDYNEVKYAKGCLDKFLDKKKCNGPLPLMYVDEKVNNLIGSINDWEIKEENTIEGKQKFLLGKGIVYYGGTSETVKISKEKDCVEKVKEIVSVGFSVL